MLAWERARAELTGARAFCARDGGRPVSMCLLLATDHADEVERVYTTPSHRGRGLAHAVVAHAAPRGGRPAHVPLHRRPRRRAAPLRAAGLPARVGRLPVLHRRRAPAVRPPAAGEVDGARARSARTPRRRRSARPRRTARPARPRRRGRRPSRCRRRRARRAPSTVNAPPSRRRSSCCTRRVTCSRIGRSSNGAASSAREARLPLSTDAGLDQRRRAALDTYSFSPALTMPSLRASSSTASVRSSRRLSVAQLARCASRSSATSSRLRLASA